jgi:hypothetical protein
MIPVPANGQDKRSQNSDEVVVSAVLSRNELLYVDVRESVDSDLAES